MADCGVYKITNTVNGNFYIGSSCNLRQRLRDHRSRLVNNTHINEHLQRAWNKYGEQAFAFSTVLLCDIESKLYYEQVLLDGLKPVYNIAVCAAAARQGLRMSEENKRKLLEANTGRRMSEETKRKLLEANTGRHPSKATRRKMSESNKDERHYLFGKHHTEETKQKMSEAHKGELHYGFGRNLSDEHKRKLSGVHTGMHPSEETRRKMSESQKRRYAEACNA